MPHAIVDETYIHPTPTSSRKSKSKSPNKSREQQHLQTVISDLQALYSTSQLSQNLHKTLASTLKTTKTVPTRILSLGLGNLTTSGKPQSRRLKQLVMLLSLRTVLQTLTSNPNIEIYAQDPIFTRQDETLLSSYSIQILRTTSGSSLGEAATLLTPSTLVYSPFLTLEAYEQLLLHSHQKDEVKWLVGDDFNALREKWPKFSAERKQVEGLLRGAVEKRFRRRGVAGDGFWVEEDGGFPVAVYGVVERRDVAVRAKI